MELSFLNVLLFLAFFVLTLILIFSSKISSNINLHLPPGSTGYPYLGETLQFYFMGKRGIPEKFFSDRMKKYSNQVFKTSLLSNKTAVFCGVSGNKFIFSNENKLVAVSLPNVVKKMFGYTNAEANEVLMRLRGNLNRIYSPDSLQHFVGIVDSTAQLHLKNHWNVENGDELSALAEVKQFAFSVSCKLFMNIDYDHNHHESLTEMKELGRKFEVLVAGMYSIPVNFPGTASNLAIRGSISIKMKLQEILMQRRKKLSDDHADYMSCLLTAKTDSRLDEPEMIDHLLVLLLSSRDSTTSAITCTMKFLAEYPDVYGQVLKEQRSIGESKQNGESLNWKDLQKMKYTWNVVREVMRLLPPMQGNYREALSDFSYANFFIPKGWKLYCSPNTTHRDSEYFPEPEKFDPTRFEREKLVPYAYVPFGGGSHICPGKDIARLIILTFLYNVVGKYRWEMLIPDEKVVVLPVPLPEKGLPIRLFPH